MNLLAILACSSIGLHVQGPDLKVSLSDAIKLANEHSTIIHLAKNDLDAAKARLGQRNAKSLPSLGFSGSATRFDDATNVNFGGNTLPLLPDHQEQLSLALTQDLNISGYVGATIAQSKLLYLSAGYAVEAAKQDQELTTTTAFYAVRRAEQAVEVAKASLEDYKQQLATTTKLFQGGIGQKIDVYRAQSQVADSERELTRRRNDLSSANSVMNDLLGRPLDDPLVLVEPEVVPASTEITQPDDHSKLIAQALDRRSEALAAHLQVAAAEKGIKVAQAANGANASVSLGGTHYPTTSFSSPRENVGTLTVMVSVPIFDGGLGREQVNEARSMVRSAKEREIETRRAIALQVQKADLDVETARKSLDAAKVALKAADAARKLAQERYEAQVALYLEVTDAQSALTAAQAALVDATYDLITAQARLSRALSEPITH